MATNTIDGTNNRQLPRRVWRLAIPAVAVPDVHTAFADALVDGVATPETAYVALLEGMPDEIDPSFAMNCGT